MNAVMGIERLEGRRLLTTSVIVTDGVLNIVDDDSSTYVQYKKTSSTFSVLADGVTIFSTNVGTWTQVMLYGNGGDDKLEYTTSLASNFGITIMGGDGNDTLIGGTGYDLLQGGDDNDWLRGMNGSDTLEGGAGDDTIVSSAGNEVYYGGAGNDTMDFTPNTNNGGVLVTLDDVYNDQAYGWAQNVHSDLEIILGNSGADTITGSASNRETIYGYGSGDVITANGTGAYADEIYGGDGNDTLNGGDGDDIINGGAGSDLIRGYGGNDSLWGETGRDSIYGGDGDDTFFLDNDISIDIIDGGNGYDTAKSTLLSILDSLSNIEQIDLI